MKQVDLARAIGMQPANLSRIETGQRCPSGPTLQKIARALNVDANDILLFASEAVAS